MSEYSAKNYTSESYLQNKNNLMSVMVMSKTNIGNHDDQLKFNETIDSSEPSVDLRPETELR